MTMLVNVDLGLLESSVTSISMSVIIIYVRMELNALTRLMVINVNVKKDGLDSIVSQISMIVLELINVNMEVLASIC